MCPQTRKYYFIIVHYGDPKLTDAALVSLQKCQCLPNDIIVVDNAKLSYSPPHAAKPHLLLRPNRNTGYAGGLNLGLGILASRGATADDIVVVMNNDIFLSHDALRQLRDWWQAHPSDSLLGLSRSHVNLRTGRSHPHQPASQSHHLDYLDGAFLSAPYRVFLKAQGLPAHYFMYWEDVLFSVRVRRQGIPLQHTANRKLQHHSSPSTDPGRDKLYYLVRNGALFLEQETAWPWNLYWYLANRARLIYHTRWPYRSSVVRSALCDAVRGNTGSREI